MYWNDEGYLIGKNNFDENSVIIEVFTLEHGKCSGIVYGGSSRKQKKILQIGNKILINWKSKSENKIGYFTTELIKPVSPIFFDDKKRSISILSAVSILRILLPARQVNRDIYLSLEKLLNKLDNLNWINLYIYWEISLIKQLGFETDFLNSKNSNILFNDPSKTSYSHLKIPNILLSESNKKLSNAEIREALIFNRKLFMENFIVPNKLKLPSFRNILEKYYT